ncbi:MAG TPA: hypothetical protein VFS44_00750 [Gemmatimonadaceae bacterium]|nr:hypothetical protein [Gemmatimonadaceae bacterium]
MGDPGPYIVATFAIIATTVVLLARILVGRGKHGGAADPARLQAMEERLARMEQAIDAIAIETERIAEGQRFTTRLLTERAKEPAS